jgi:hypothetical protein
MPFSAMLAQLGHGSGPGPHLDVAVKPVSSALGQILPGHSFIVPNGLTHSLVEIDEIDVVKQAPHGRLGKLEVADIALAALVLSPEETAIHVNDGAI